MINLQDKLYHQKYKDMNKKIDLTKQYQYIFSSNDNKNIVEFYLNDKLKLKAEYNVIGLYNMTISVWYWGWNIAFINKKLIYEISKIKQSVQNLLKSNEIKNKDKEELYYLVNNDNFYISNENVNKILKLVLFCTPGLWIFPVIYQTEQLDRIEYILITKILQIH